MLDYLTRALRSKGPAPTAKMLRFRKRVATQRAREAEHITRLQLAAGTPTIGPSPLTAGQVPELTLAASTVNSRGIPLTLATGLEAVKQAKTNAARSDTVTRAEQVIAESEQLWDAIYERELAANGLALADVVFAAGDDEREALSLLSAQKDTRGSERYQIAEQLRAHVARLFATGKAHFVGEQSRPAKNEGRVIRSTPENWPLMQELIAARDAWRKQGGLRSGKAFAEMQRIFKQIEMTRSGHEQHA